MRPRQILRRILKRALQALGWILLSVSLVALLVVSLIAIRPQIVIAVVTRVLEPVFQGSIEITDVEFIAFDHVEGVDALLRDPEGRVIAELHDLNASLPLFDVLDQIVRGAPTLTIDLKRVHARYARVDLSTNAQRELRLAEALEPQPSKSPQASSQEVIVRLRSIVFDEAWVHGAPHPTLPLDVGVDQLSTALVLEGSQLTIGPADLRADARVVGPIRSVGVDFQGKGRLNIEVTESAPTEGAPRVPELLEEIHFAATLTQGESRVALSGDQNHQQLSLVAEGTYVLQEGILAQRSPIDVNVDARGTLDDLRAEVRLETSGTKSRLDLSSRWNDELVLDGEFTVDDFSPALINESAPSSLIDAVVQFQARRSRSSRLPDAQKDDPEWVHWVARVDGRFSAFGLAGEKVPPLNLTARFTPPEWYAKLETAQGKGRTQLVAKGVLDRNIPPDHLNISGHLDLAELTPYLPGLLKGTGAVDVTGRILPAKSEIEGQVDLDARNVHYGSTVSARKLQAHGTISGKLSDPQIAMRAHAEDLDLLVSPPPARHFEEVEVRWDGSFSSSELSLIAEQKERIVEARTRLTISPSFEAMETRVVLRGEGGAVSLSADQIVVDSDGIQLNDVKFSGLGEGELSGTVDRSGVTLKGYVRNVPLEGIAERFSIDLKGARGEVDLDADFKIGPGTAQGRIRLLVVKAGLIEGPRAVKDVPLLDVRLDVIGEGHNLFLVTEVTPSKKADIASHLDAVVEVVVPRGALFKQPGSWMDRVIAVKTEGSLDFTWLPAALLPEHTDILGRLDFRAKLERPDEGAVPSASLFVRTSGLHVTFPREGKIKGQEVTLTTVEGVDFTANVSHLPERGQTRAWVGVFQGQRMLAHVRGRVDATLTSLEFPQGFRSYREAPLEVHADLSRTPLQDLPEAVRIVGARGHVSMSAAVTGSFARPKLRAQAEMQGFYMDRAPPPDPLDAQLTLEYENRIASGELRVSGSSEGQEKQLLFSRAKAHFENELTAGSIALERIDASARLGDFPVNAVLPPTKAKGTLSGQVDVKGYGTSEPELKMNFDLGGMSVGDVPFEGGKLRGHADADSAEVSVNFEGKEFLLRGDANTELVWPSPYVPDLGDAATGQVEARRFPLRILHPLVTDTLADLDGKLDAKLQVRIREGEPVVSGRAVLSEGSVQLPRLGQQLGDVRAEVKWEETGLVTLKNASFRGVTGRARVEGSARMDGILPQSARIELKVDRTERLPLSIQGLGVGEFWGDVRGEVELSWEEKRVNTEVNFRDFQVVFPEIVTGGVQSLKPDEHVSAGAWVNEEEFVVIPLQPVEKKKKEGESWMVRTRIDLGNDFWVQQGPRRRIQIGGELLINAEDEVTVEGQLSLSRGRIQLNGRMFEIDEGTVTFQPDDPGNPIIVAEARWQSPEGTVVIARFLGPVESGEMTLTSEPPLPQDQIVSLLLFGDTAGLNGADSGGGNNGAQAVAVGGSVATQGFNQALSRVEAIDISTRIDTTGSDVVRPEVVVQLTNSVSAQVGYNLEEPSPGESPDRTVATLEVRLSGGNAVSVTLGDRGSAFFDWVWRYRY